MSDSDWDADEFETNLDIKPVIKDRWEGEDEEDDVKDNWDDDDEVKEKVEQVKTEALVPPVKKKKLLKEKIAEREQQKDKKMDNQLTPKQMFEERQKWEKEQQKADLELALEALGLDHPKDAGEIDTFEPSTKDDFTKLASLIASKIESYKNSPFYNAFLEDLLRDLVAGVDVDGMRKVTSSLTALYNEKLKLSKAKTKKKPVKATLNTGKANDRFKEDDAADYGYDDDYDV